MRNLLLTYPPNQTTQVSSITCNQVYISIEASFSVREKETTTTNTLQQAAERVRDAPRLIYRITVEFIVKLVIIIVTKAASQ